LGRNKLADFDYGVTTVLIEVPYEEFQSAQMYEEN